MIKDDEAEELCKLCDTLGDAVAKLFRTHRRKLEKAYRDTPLSDRGWDFGAIGQFVFANVQRHAREQLEEEGILASAMPHRNGVDWVFWAEEPRANRNKRGIGATNGSDNLQR